MTQRISLAKSNAGLDSMRAVETWLDKNLDPKLLALVKVRASQINGCAFCLHMHSEQALKLGENSARLLLLDAWRESALYTERERAALAWTDSLTRISKTHAPDADFERVRSHFSEAACDSVDRHRHDQRMEPPGDRRTGTTSRGYP
jgi:AhpD family alkylhydroperoxidase